MKNTLAIFLLLSASTHGAGPAGSAFSRITELTLKESPGDILRRFGPPDRVSETPVHKFWQYDEFEDSEFSWAFTFDRKSSRLVAAAWTFPGSKDFAKLFGPQAIKRVNKEGLELRIERLGSGRVLAALGTHQLMLVSSNEIPRLFPWLEPIQ